MRPSIREREIGWGLQERVRAGILITGETAGLRAAWHHVSRGLGSMVGARPLIAHHIS